MHARYQPCVPHTAELWPWVCSSFLASSYKIGMRIVALRAGGHHLASTACGLCSYCWHQYPGFMGTLPGTQVHWHW